MSTEFVQDILAMHMFNMSLYDKLQSVYVVWYSISMILTTIFKAVSIVYYIWLIFILYNPFIALEGNCFCDKETDSRNFCLRKDVRTFTYQNATNEGRVIQGGIIEDVM